MCTCVCLHVCLTHVPPSVSMRVRACLVGYAEGGGVGVGVVENCGEKNGC